MSEAAESSPEVYRHRPVSGPYEQLQDGARWANGWKAAGACSVEPAELFFAPDGERSTSSSRLEREDLAKSICRTCKVLDECREFAIEHKIKFGIWGGLNEDELNAERTRRQRKKARISRLRVLNSQAEDA